MSWGPRTPEQYKEHQEEMKTERAIEPFKQQILAHEKTIRKQERIINLLKKHIIKQGDDDLVLELIESLLEE